MYLKSKLLILSLLIYVKNGCCCSDDKRPLLSLIGAVIKSVRNIKFLDQNGPLDMFCSGEDAKRLMLSVESGSALKLLRTKIVNETTVRFYVPMKEKQLALYRCWDGDASCKSEVFLVVDEQPEFSDFNCVSKNFVYLNCSWTSGNVLAVYNIFLTNKGNLKICKVVVKEVAGDIRFCDWKYYNDISYLYERFLDLNLETCSNFVCRSKTVHVDHLSIVKLDPPINVDLISKSSRNVVLQWEIPKETHRLLDGVDHRVEYWYPGILPLEVNTTSVSKDLNKYRLNIPLPCGNQYYEVNISIRPKQARNDEYWSDHASFYFVTNHEIEEDGSSHEATCEKLQVKLTPEIILYELDLFRTKMMDEQAQVEIMINDLKAKAVRIEESTKEEITPAESQ